MSSRIDQIALEEMARVASLELVGGVGAGKVFDLSPDRVTIGREMDNDIVLEGESVSRHHATLEHSEDNRYRIFDNQSKNGVVINGERVEAAELQHGDLIQLGAFTFRFVLGDEAVEISDDNGAMEVQGAGVPEIIREAAAMKGASNRKRLLIYALAVLLLGGLYMMSSEETPQSDVKTTVDGDDKFNVSKAPTFEGEPTSSSDALKKDPALSSAEQELSRLDWTNSSVQEAESYFRKGQREYFNKNYHRAIDNFKASLAMYKSHPLSRHYLQAAIHDAEVEAKKHYEIGVKYFESLQYSRAIYHFSQFIELMSHRKNDALVGEAEKFIKVSQQKLQSVEMFP